MTTFGLKHLFRACGLRFGDGNSLRLLVEQLTFVITMNTWLGGEGVWSVVERFIVVLAGEKPA